MSPIYDMNNRVKQNREMLPSKRAKFKGDNREVAYASERKSERVLFKNVSEEKLISIKERIRARAKTERKRDVLIYVVITFLFLLLLLGFVVNFYLTDL